MIDPMLPRHNEEHRMDLLREAAEARLARRLCGQSRPPARRISRAARDTLRTFLAASWAADGREGTRP